MAVGQDGPPAGLGLGCCVLVVLLLLGGSGSPGTPPPPRATWAERQGHAGEGAPRGRANLEGYEAVKKHLGAVGALSKQYWQYLACKVWQEGCEEEKEEQKEPGPSPGWSLPLVGQDYLEILSAWYCSFGKCCETGDCRIVNNITGLEADLSEQLHGQHLAKEVVVRAVQGFLQSPQPKKALVLSFHGWSGTGKNFVARMVASHLYRDGLRSDCVRVFISLLHFPHHKYLDSYKAQLQRQLSETLQLCRQSLFIFDEAEKLHSSLLDAIRPFMAPYGNEGQADQQRAIFLFLSNLGGNTINEVALDFWRAGRAREEISMEFLEQRLRLELQEPAENSYAHSHLLRENLIDFLVPFLPLEFHHVKLCARDAFLARGLPFSEATLDAVARMMVFVPKEEKLFSAQGCKSVPQRINYFLP
ncbi:torsin-3A [Pipra filicauda]|uniref:Torsin-3A n=1 Tax=Pipra filicauda TaxID=649802 RepID=A0A6J2I8M2_9PASS|nr:torsin-3A [Pipra filicauda]XP_039239995.1 torsin-3A [Pipra filicauda]XP_039240004.1 torsin-3A [Pipra filicauda]